MLLPFKVVILVRVDLNLTSNIRPNRLFTADREIILYKAGQLKTEKLNEAIAKIVEIIQQ